MKKKNKTLIKSESLETFIDLKHLTDDELKSFGRRSAIDLISAIMEARTRGWKERQIAEAFSIPKSTVHRWLELAPSGANKPRKLPPPKPSSYRTLVVDPPWPIEKIQRNVRPNQDFIDYETMDLDEIFGLDVPIWADDHAHLYLWTTHKHLPDALEIMSHWGFAYQCLLTWIKNVGITPFSWMYSTELVLFGRRGGLDLAQMGRRLDFSAKVREHSRKPEIFYDLVRDVSPAPRLDAFSRENHDGFDSWGYETGKFATKRFLGN